jgi:DNA-directed RNA polymerase specialized sigma24 family protein
MEANYHDVPNGIVPSDIRACSCGAIDSPDYDKFFYASYEALAEMLRGFGADEQQVKDGVDDAMVRVNCHWRDISNPFAWAEQLALASFLELRYREDRYRFLVGEGELAREVPKGADLELFAYKRLWVDRFLQQLSTRQRHVFGSIYLGYSTDEIVQLIDMPTTVVRTHMQRVRGGPVGHNRG